MTEDVSAVFCTDREAVMFWEGLLSTLLLTSAQHSDQVSGDYRQDSPSYEYFAEIEASVQRIEEFGHLCLLKVDTGSEACRSFSDEYHNAAWKLTQNNKVLPWKYAAVMRAWEGLYRALNQR